MENSSQQLNEFAMALSKFQGSIGSIPKTKTAKMGAYTYKYADLADINSITQKPLSTNGLSVVQRFIRNEKETYLQTILMHNSGQWISSELPIHTYEKVQQLGSEITYLRRYALSSILGLVTDDDDDGKLAQEAKENKEETLDSEPLLPYQCEELENMIGEDEEMRKRLLVYYGKKTKNEKEKIRDFCKKDFDWVKDLLETQKKRIQK